MASSRFSATALVFALVLGLVGLAPPASANHVTHVTVPSKADGLGVRISIYRPPGADATNQVPVILHSHGWSGSRTSSEGSFGAWLNDGFAVVSIDQRGHGQTGGTAHVQNPDLEAQDIISVIDHIATLDWILKDRDANGDVIEDDPVMGAIGGSYGGGYQLITALQEVRESETGSTRFNALAPEITWNNLSQSLGPQDVPRTLWTTLLYAVGIGILPDYVHQSQVLGSATGTFPNGEIPGTYNLKDRFYRNSPAWFAENGYKLDIPVLFGQGTSDNLFPLNEGYHNYESVLTDEARERSLLVGYNGGHVLPSALPAGTSSGSDACSGGFANLTQRFFKIAFGLETDPDAPANPADLLPTRYSLTSAGGQCIRVETFDPTETKAVGDGLIATPALAGAPISLPILQGPATIAGVPVLRGNLTSLGVDTRAFFALSVGTSPANAQILQNNTMPLRQRLPVVDEPMSLELPGVGATLGANQTLYLTVSPVADMFAGMNRFPGALLITDAVVDLPLH